MKVPLMRVLCILAALAAMIFSVVTGGTWYLGPIAAALFVLAAVSSQSADDSRVLILATGELLVIAVAASSFPAGFIVQCAVIGAVLFDGEGLPGTRDSLLFALWCIAALAGAVVLYVSNQVLLPFLAITAGVAALTVLLVSVQEMRECRMYAGGTR